MSIRNDRIKAMMIEDSISVAEFAKGIGKSKVTAKAIIEGKLNPTSNIIVAICDYLNCDADYLLGRSDVRYYF